MQQITVFSWASMSLNFGLNPHEFDDFGEFDRLSSGSEDVQSGTLLRSTVEKRTMPSSSSDENLLSESD